MTWWRQWRDSMTVQARVAEWRASGALAPAAARRAGELVGRQPSAILWRGFLRHLSLWLAVALLAAGLVCLVAANWEQLGRSARLYGGQAVLVLAVLAAWRLGLARAGGQAALILAAVALGGLLALLGQTYQTGADTWQLFALWAALLVPWLLAARGTAMTLLWLVVAQLALVLWLGEHGAGPRLIWLLVGLLNAGLYLAWHGPGQRLPGLAGTLGPRLLALAALAVLVPAALSDVFAWRGLYGTGLLACALAASAIAWTAWRPPRDVLLLSAVALAVIVVDTVLLGRLLFELRLEAMAFLLLTGAVIGQVAWVTRWLRDLGRDGSPPVPVAVEGGTADG